MNEKVYQKGDAILYQGALAKVIHVALPADTNSGTEIHYTIQPVGLNAFKLVPASKLEECKRIFNPDCSAVFKVCKIAGATFQNFLLKLSETNKAEFSKYIYLSNTFMVLGITSNKHVICIFHDEVPEAISKAIRGKLNHLFPEYC